MLECDAGCVWCEVYGGDVAVRCLNLLMYTLRVYCVFIYLMRLSLT